MWLWRQFRKNGDHAVVNEDVIPKMWGANHEHKLFSHTFIVAYPEKLYPAEEQLPVRSEEIPIFPNLKRQHMTREWWIVRCVRNDPRWDTTSPPGSVMRSGPGRPTSPVDWFDPIYYMSNTRGMCYPRDLYPAEEDLPVYSNEVPIWPDLKS